MSKKETHDNQYNAPAVVRTGVPQLLRKLNSAGASFYASPRPRLYKSGKQSKRQIDHSAKEHHRRLQDRAKQRRDALLAAQAKAHKDTVAQNDLKSKHLEGPLSSLRRFSLEILNPVRWMEKQKRNDEQKLVDQLLHEYDDALEYQQSMDLCKESAHACLAAVSNHLQHFLQDHPTATYETWIQELHPENTYSLDDETVEVDQRFYLKDSDHRRLWNENLGSSGERAHVQHRHGF